jgi:hypothetical protein
LKNESLKKFLAISRTDLAHQHKTLHTATYIPVGGGEGGTSTALSTTLLHYKLIHISSVTLCYSIVDSMYVYNT